MHARSDNTQSRVSVTQHDFVRPRIALNSSQPQNLALTVINPTDNVEDTNTIPHNKPLNIWIIDGKLFQCACNFRDREPCVKIIGVRRPVEALVPAALMQVGQEASLCRFSQSVNYSEEPVETRYEDCVCVSWRGDGSRPTREWFADWLTAVTCCAGYNVKTVSTTKFENVLHLIPDINVSGVQYTV